MIGGRRPAAGNRRRAAPPSGKRDRPHFRSAV